MSIRLEQLTKRYDGKPVVSNVTLDVGRGEICVLLGPSGSGKSTVLRLIAGLAPIDGGRILLDGSDLAGVPARRREIGLVFQNYALFRHLTVAENIEFALRVRGEPTGARRTRRDELLELVGLAGLGGRLPSQLSGGQQQRVALARALAHRPRVLLLDEPFGALDARIRVDLRRALMHVQRELGVTMLFVTHDQEEALELADRLAVMSHGRLVEDGPPRELYLRPQTSFVATFLGGANLLVGEASAEGVRVGSVAMPLPEGLAATPGTRRVQVLIRPEDVVVVPETGVLEHPALGEGVVEEVAFAGAMERLRVNVKAQPGVRVIHPPRAFGDASLPLDVTRWPQEARRTPLVPGARVKVGASRVHALQHPGIAMVFVDDHRPASEPARALAGELARLAQARLEGLTMAELPSRLAREPVDIVVAPLARHGGADAALGLLAAGAPAHLLLVRGERPMPPQRVLLAFAVGEPGKEGAGHAGRLARHLGAPATVLSVLDRGGEAGVRAAADRFLAGCVQTLAALGVAASARLADGPLRSTLEREMADGHDLLVLGAPLPDAHGRVEWGSVTRQILDDANDYPVLIVRAARGTGAEPEGGVA